MRRSAENMQGVFFSDGVRGKTHLCFFSLTCCARDLVLILRQTASIDERLAAYTTQLEIKGKWPLLHARVCVALDVYVVCVRMYLCASVMARVRTWERSCAVLICRYCYVDHSLRPATLSLWALLTSACCSPVAACARLWHCLVVLAVASHCCTPDGKNFTQKKGGRRSSSLRRAGSASVAARPDTGGSQAGGEEGGGSGGGGGGGVGGEPMPADLEKEQADFYRKSAEEHREFLLKTLQQVKDQLQQPSALLETNDDDAVATAD
jgi:hypothetical protein